MNDLPIISIPADRGLEEIALRKGCLDAETFAKEITRLPKSAYRDYLQAIANDGTSFRG